MMTYRMRAAWGEDRWVREQGAAIFTGDGKLVAIEGLLTDITDQKTKELKLQAENLRLRASMNERYRLGPLIGKSAAMQKIYNRILKAAESTASVIVTGESGTGKELAARAIHDLSDRRSGPFVTVNCGAIAENLVESEFFGHLKGAFSGAYTHKDGFLVAAEGGTLFLDEIGEMPLAFQVKLLRALDGKGFSPVGDNKIRTADFRLISATNRDPGHMVHAGLMREDFYYRVNTIPILMPPLRERKDDLPLLIDHFVAMYHEETGRLAEVPPEILPKLAQHDWPGNIRELQNVIRRYLTLKEIHFSPHGQRSSEPGGLATSLSATGTVGPELERTEREIILRALGDNHWHMGRSATALGISRRTLQRRVNKYGLRLASYRPDVAD
jgi:transcriptional regulator with PAS, ATPase and Fis domain